MRKTIIYIFILALLGFSVYFFLFRGNKPTYDDKEAGFTIKDTAILGKIFLAGPAGQTILLERTDSGWMLNKKYKVLASTLHEMMMTMNQQEALYPVTTAAHDAAIKQLSADGVKVELYGRDGHKLKAFYVGGIAPNNTGTNMLMEGAKEPYVVHIQGFNGYLSPRYPVRLTDWRDRTVFNIPAAEIKTISVQYKDNPTNSFVVNKEGDSVTISADAGIVHGLEGFNPKRAHSYTTFFTNVNCEGYLNGLSDMDTTLKTAPMQSVVEVTGIHGQHQKADMYWMALNKRSKNIQSTNVDVPDDYDADRLYAVINNNQDTVMIQRFAFNKIFRKAFEFYMQSDSSHSQQRVAPPRLKGLYKKL